MSPSLRSRGRDRGFSLLEVTVAIIILSVGLMSMGVLLERMMRGGQTSKYMSEAALLASEKLEDLNRWDAYEPAVCVSSLNSSQGSLTADIGPQWVTCPPKPGGPAGVSGYTSYYDEINIALNAGNGINCPSTTAGCFAETVSTVSNGNTVYLTTFHSADGTVQTPPASNSPPATQTFHRRWIIEANPLVNANPSPLTMTGVRRVTVLVTQTDLSVQSPVTFQMSMVRP